MYVCMCVYIQIEITTGIGKSIIVYVSSACCFDERYETNVCSIRVVEQGFVI